MDDPPKPIWDCCVQGKGTGNGWGGGGEGGMNFRGLFFYCCGRGMFYRAVKHHIILQYLLNMYLLLQ
jgi:hypothetical protein